MVTFALEHLNDRRVDTSRWAIWNDVHLRTSFLIRDVELAILRLVDVGFKADDHGVYIAIFSQGPKTDVKSRGAPMPLYATESPFCEVRRLERFAHLRKKL